MLTPLPTTPLYDRLRAEGRLDFSDPELIFIPKQMSRERLKSGFRELLKRVYDVDAYFERALGAAASTPQRRPGARSVASTRLSVLKLRLLLTAGWAARALMLAYVMAGQGQLLRHLRAAPRVLRRNAALGPRALGFAEMVNHWITYWHFASVTRQLSGTRFGNVPDAV
jgi:hypothetical protein